MSRYDQLVKPAPKAQLKFLFLVKKIRCAFLEADHHDDAIGDRRLGYRLHRFREELERLLLIMSGQNKEIGIFGC